MVEPLDTRKNLAVELLRIFPPSIGVDALEDTVFRERYGLSLDATITFNGLDASIKRSALFPAIRALYANPQTSIPVKTVDGTSAKLSMELEKEPKLFLSLGEARHEIPSFWMLAENKDIRLSGFQVEVAERNLPTDTIESWRQKIEERPLSDEEMSDLKEDLALVPQEVAKAIRHEAMQNEGRVSVLVPRNARYYRGLIGDRGDAANVEKYAAGNAKAQVDRLLNWDFGRGLAQCLLFCANPRLSALIDISGKAPEEVKSFFRWLANEGDRFSQIAGVEVGIRAFSKYPQIEPYLVKIIEDVRDENPSDKDGRLALTAHLFVFADGELARTRCFADAPPYWRRLAATAQASILERAIVSLGGAGEDWSEWAHLRAQHFFMQTLADLREEPRWLPDLMTPAQLRLELLMRARIVSNEFQSDISDGPLRSLVLGKEPNQLETLTSVPTAAAPSPVEGGIAAPIEFPKDLQADLRAPQDGKVLEAKIFASVVNFSMTFHFDKEIAGLISNLLRSVKYRLAFEQDADITFTLLMGLASIAASARYPELADELRILTRVLGRRGDLKADAEAKMRIALVACASRKDKLEWCKTVGEWLLEIANGELERKEAARFRSHLRTLCHAVPELWQHTAKVDATLSALCD
ncbi:hypothetical protein [Mesorhizobium sp. M0040]|uniref:hypothetical protein n=1 Tax=Mesorhizobium sp. M0040 TaxID=2956855 RepID=UPI0033381077